MYIYIYIGEWPSLYIYMHSNLVAIVPVGVPPSPCPRGEGGDATWTTHPHPIIVAQTHRQRDTQRDSVNGIIEVALCVNR
jgi:hypothetical protein